MIILRKAFVKCTSLQTWENAMQKFPFYATDNQLKCFIKVDVRKEVPQPFMDFCRSATGEKVIMAQPFTTVFALVQQLSLSLIQKHLNLVLTESS